MIVNYTLLHGLICGIVVNGYIFLLMVTMSPRIWGYQDYPQRIKVKVPPQTRHERMIAGVVGFPFILFVVVFPLYSVLTLKTLMGGEIPFIDAFIHLLVLFMSANMGDIVILDWLIISKITPGFAIIPGSEAEDYKDFSHHYRDHLKATMIMIVVSGLIALIVSNF